MGVAERWLRTHFSPELVDHHTYVIAGDGCLEEGISHEAASLAGHLGLGRLVYVYDDNHISIDGPTELALDDDAAERFAAYGWSVDDIGDVANDLDVLEAALLRARAEEDRPSLIILRSHIGYPSPHLTDSAKAHGDPFSDEEARLTKEILGLPPTRPSGCPTRCWPCTAPPSRVARPCGPSGRPGSRPGTATGHGSMRPWPATGCPAGRRTSRPSPRGRADGHPQGHQGLPGRHRRPAARAPAGQRRPDRQHRHGPGRGHRPVGPGPGGSLLHYGIREHAMGPS